jgi:general L-amino acid transport system substrate-binding protein
MWTLALVLAGATLALAGCDIGDDDEGDDAAGTAAAPGQSGGDLLQQVKDRGNLICGVNDAVPGFGFVTGAGDFEGFDIDFCRAIATAVFGDPKAVEFRPLTTAQRFTALASGEVDVLIRNTTWNASRDGSEGARFLTTTFYDGQGMMVRADSTFQSLEDLDGATICTLSGTTTDLNLASQFELRNLELERLAFEESESLQQAFQQGRCEAWTSDQSQLAGIRSAWPEAQGGPDAVRILDVTMSKEPLGPVVRDGQEDWADVVNWVVIATIQAEELGVTSQNIDQQLESGDPEIRRLLGQTSEGEAFDPGLGLEPDFAVEVIRQVGNYGEIYDRNVGPNTGLGLERGVNALWTQGGLHYAPPYR